MNNSQIIQKADMTLADLASGGLLNPEQSASFIRKMRTAPTILQNMRTVVMSASKRNINKIGFGSRILRPAVSATPLIVGDRSKPTTTQVQLDTKEVIAEVRLPYDVIEDNIEQGNINVNESLNGSGVPNGAFKETIMAMIAEAAAIDLEELALLGDTGSADPYLALLDGFLASATSNIVDATGNPISRSIFKNGIKTLPDAYKKVLPTLRNYVSMDNFTEYQDTRANRETAGGDSVNDQVAPTLYALGTRVEGAAVMPAANGILCNPKNMIWGIQRNISIEVDKDISSRVFIIVLTARTDFKFEEEEAVVKYTNIG